MFEGNWDAGNPLVYLLMVGFLSHSDNKPCVSTCGRKIVMAHCMTISLLTIILWWHSVIAYIYIYIIYIYHHIRFCAATPIHINRRLVILLIPGHMQGLILTITTHYFDMNKHHTYFPPNLGRFPTLSEHIILYFLAHSILTASGAATWWRHQMKRPVTRLFDVFFDLRLSKRLSIQSRRRWFETPPRSLWRHCHEWRKFR